MIIEGAMTVLFGFSNLIFLSCIVTGIGAGMTPILNAHSQTIWQTQTPRELQGRVFSVRRLIAQFSWPASSFLMGALASQFEPGTILMALGAVLVVWCVIGLFNPYLRKVEDKDWIEAKARERAAAKRTIKAS